MTAQRRFIEAVKRALAFLLRMAKPLTGETPQLALGSAKAEGAT
jgi:hypothetical protein